MDFIYLIPRRIALRAIRIYQLTISPDHGFMRRFYPPTIGCKFHPSCSEYTYQAIEQRGLIRGFFLGTGRILRCNPWSAGGGDPVPKK